MMPSRRGGCDADQVELFIKSAYNKEKYFERRNPRMKIKGWVLLLMITLSVFGLAACEAEQDQGQTPTYEQISTREAKEIMDKEKEYVIIDARTDSEFAEGHIEGAILIPEYEIAARAEQELPRKDALIIVYCRSGRRSKIASEALVKLGYTNVKEFGGIIDWPYEIVK
jgi:rhodanese-related sulfurtransferase